MPLSTVYRLYRGGQCTYPCFPGVLLTSAQHNIFSKRWLLSHMTIVETTDSSERGMNPVAMTVEILGKNKGRAGDRTCSQVRNAND